MPIIKRKEQRIKRKKKKKKRDKIIFKQNIPEEGWLSWTRISRTSSRQLHLYVPQSWRSSLRTYKHFHILFMTPSPMRYIVCLFIKFWTFRDTQCIHIFTKDNDSYKKEVCKIACWSVSCCKVQTKGTSKPQSVKLVLNSKANWQLTAELASIILEAGLPAVPDSSRLDGKSRPVRSIFIYIDLIMQCTENQNLKFTKM